MFAAGLIVAAAASAQDGAIAAPPLDSIPLPGAAAPPAQSAAPGQGFALALDAGTLGVGLEGVYGLGRYFGVRAQVNGFEFSQRLHDDGIRYTAKLRLLTEGGLLDWHPFGGRFRFSAGGYHNSDRIALKTLCGGSGCNLHKFTISNDGQQDPEIRGAATFHALAPYFGLGFGNALYGSRWLFAFDLGVIDQGSPRVSLIATGSGTITDNSTHRSRNTANLGTDPEVAGAVVQEQQDAQSGVDHYKLYPVISLAVGYRFF